MNMKKLLLTFLDCFFASKISLEKRIFFIIIAGTISLITFVSFSTQDYFDELNESHIFSGIYAYANTDTLDVNYVPFKTPLIVFDAPSTYFSGSGFGVHSLPNEDSDYQYYRSQYGLLSHSGALLVRALNIKNVKAIKVTIYGLAALLSLAIFLGFLLFLFNQTGNILPIILAGLIWGAIRTDVSLWFHYGLKILPSVIFAIVFVKIASYKNYTRWLILFITVTLLFYISALVNYDSLPIIITTLLAIHCHSVNEKEIKYKLWIGEGILIGIAILAGSLLAMKTHLQIIDLQELLYNSTKRSSAGVITKYDLGINYSYVSLYLIPQLIMTLIVPSFAIIALLGRKKSLVPIFSLYAAFSGLVIWCLIFPFIIELFWHIQQAYFYGLPMLLIIFNREDISSKINIYLKKILAT